MARKPKRNKPVSYKLLEASAILGISVQDLELALDMLEALKKKMDAWENGLSEKD